MEEIDNLTMAITNITNIGLNDIKDLSNEDIFNIDRLSSRLTDFVRLLTKLEINFSERVKKHNVEKAISREHNDINQYEIPEQADRIYKYIKTHPGCTRADLCRLFKEREVVTMVVSLLLMDRIKEVQHKHRKLLYITNNR